MHTPNFNLRTKLVIGFTAFLVLSTYINLMFLKDFESFERNVKMLTHASNISNLSLEIRRWEKNFIIGNKIEDFNTASSFITQLLDYLDDLEPRSKERHASFFIELEDMIKQYAVHFNGLESECVGDLALSDCDHLEAVHILGAAIVTLAEGMVRDSQQEVESFARDSKIKLVLYFTFLIVFSLCGMIVFFYTIGSRLKALENAANAIATGDYKSLPQSKLNDEVQIVFKAFDRMTEVLEDRQELLFQAEKMSSIGTLASGMAHQLNNPLNNIATSCQLAQEEADNPEDKEFLQRLLHTIEDETQRAAEIVRGLLEFSRQEMFKQQPASIKILISKVVSLVLSDVPTGIKIIQDIPEELTASIDEQKMKEVFINLILNGIQAIKEETGKIVIAAEQDTDTGSIVITVYDTGIGIEEEFLQQIFDPFYTTKEVGQGTGLGLSVVYGIIKKHDGTIMVRNNKNKGTTFVITLPPATMASNGRLPRADR
ncbi:MAG: HAMP domain-containing sensor histidine kinase [Desulfofustis sp.]